MYDELKARRLNLLYHALKESPDGVYITLDGQPAYNAGYEDDRVLRFDINQLEQDGAVEEAPDHPSAGLAGMKPYRITEEGRSMLSQADYPLPPPKG